MARYLLDSTIILEILSGSAKGKKAVEMVGGNELTTSVICFCEVLNKADKERRAKVKAFLSRVMVFSVSLEDGDVASAIAESCRNAGEYVPTLDCLIAASARNNDAVVITTDSDFARMDGIGKILL